MATWTDPEFEDTLRNADLIVLGRVESATPQQATVRVEDVYAGDVKAGAQVTIKRAAVVGVGHEGSVLPSGEPFVFVAKSTDAGYQAQTDSYWTFRLADDNANVHMPVRDPFTRAYIPVREMGAIVALVRDRDASVARPQGCLLLRWLAGLKSKSADRAAFVTDYVQRLTKTPVQATQPVEVNTQVLGLELAYLMGEPDQHVDAIAPYLDSPHYQVRWAAARALKTCGGASAKAAQALVARLSREDVPPVIGALGEALFASVTAGAQGVKREALMAAIPKAPGEPLPYTQELMSPINNRMPAPRDTLAAVLMKLGGLPGDLKLLRDRASQAAKGIG